LAATTAGSIEVKEFLILEPRPSLDDIYETISN
jgi:uncharacterized pyridoxamine 5'-phosphate oxidase family protein